jgi:hypothetical protein
MRRSLTSAALAAVSVFFLSSHFVQAQQNPSSTCAATPYGPVIADSLHPKGKPFSAVFKSTFDQKLADGNTIHAVSHYRVARDASGKTFSERPGSCYTSEDGQLHQSYWVSVSDPNSRTTERWMVDGNSRTATIIHMPAPVKPSEAESATMRADAAQQRLVLPFPEWQAEKLGTRSFMGVSAEGTRDTQNIPSGALGNTLPMVVVSERWFSRELGMTMMLIRDDPRTGRSVVELEELHQGIHLPRCSPHPRAIRLMIRQPR